MMGEKIKSAGGTQEIGLQQKGVEFQWQNYTINGVVN